MSFTVIPLYRAPTPQEPDTSGSLTTSANTIVNKIECSEETIPISDVVEESTSDPEQTIACPTEDSGTLQTTSGSATEAIREPRTDWSTEDTDIGEPPVYMLAGIKVDGDDGWEISGGHVPSFPDLCTESCF